MVQCDGKAHWELLAFDADDREKISIRNRISGGCLTGISGDLRLQPLSDFGTKESCSASEFTLRFLGGVLKDVQGNTLTYLKNSPAMDIWIPVQVDDEDSLAYVVDQWNVEVNYGPPVQLAGRASATASYQTSGVTYSRRKWLSGLVVYADKTNSFLAGLELVYEEGEEVTFHSIGYCGQAEVECILLGFFEAGAAPDIQDPEAMQVENLLKLPFLEQVTVYHDEKYFYGIEFKPNGGEGEVLSVAGKDLGSLTKSRLEPQRARDDQIVMGFYGAMSQEQDLDTSYIKDLGVIAGSFLTYSQTWDEDWTETDGENHLIRHKGKAASPFGPTEIIDRSQSDYFESVTASDPTKRHWISSMELYMGGGQYNFSWVGVYSMLFITNDVIGMRIQHSYMSPMGEKDSQVLTIGFDTLEKEHNKQVVPFGKFEYLEKIETKRLKEDWEIKGEQNWSWYRATPGLFALRFTIGSIVSEEKRVITWDGSADEATTKGFQPASDWLPFDEEKDGAIIGFYGTSNRVRNPQNQGDEETTLPAITALGGIYTPVGCAFRNKPFTEIEKLEIAGAGIVEFEEDGEKLKCK